MARLRSFAVDGVTPYLSSHIILTLRVGRIEKFLLTQTFKNGFVGGITFSSKEEIFPKSPLALF